MCSGDISVVFQTPVVLVPPRAALVIRVRLCRCAAAAAPVTLTHAMDDIVVENRPTRTTGGHTWPAAHEMVRVVLSSRAQQQRVLELGSGTGWAGLTLAARLGCEVVLSDQAEQLDQLRCNVDKHTHIAPLARVVELDFLQPVPPDLQWRTAHWSLIVASDVVYTREIALGLPVMIAALLAGATAADCVCVMAHTLRRFDDFDNQFYDALIANGLRVHEVMADGTTGSAPFGCEIELFPEQRIALLEIARK